MKDIIQDYGKTVTPELYIRALQEHPYIPQSDQCIVNIIKKYRESVYTSDKPMHIFDIGCGPARLTYKIAGLGPEYFFYAIDISESFIAYAKENRPFRCHGYLYCQDFISPPEKGQPLPNAEVILMQGVMHHVHGDDRIKFFNRIFDRLVPEGILVIGDEFIKEYESEEERVLNVAKFYLHIIDEARKGGFNELAEEEVKNLIDDCFSGTEFAGLATDKTFQYIYDWAKMINEMFYSYGAVTGLNFDANNQIHNMFEYIKRSVEDLVDSSTENFNRGDYKVSIRVFEEEAVKYGFKLKETYKIGPVDQLGGMGVLVFQKS